MPRLELYTFSLHEQSNHTGESPFRVLLREMDRWWTGWIRGGPSPSAICVTWRPGRYFLTAIHPFSCVVSLSLMLMQRLLRSRERAKAGPCRRLPEFCAIVGEADTLFIDISFFEPNRIEEKNGGSMKLVSRTDCATNEKGRRKADVRRRDKQCGVQLEQKARKE